MKHEWNPRQTSTHVGAREQALAQPLVEDPRAFPNLLRRMRERAGLTTNTLAGFMGVTEGLVREYEAGRRARHGEVRLSKLVRWAHACGCEVYVRFPNSTTPGSDER